MGGEKKRPTSLRACESSKTKVERGESTAGGCICGKKLLKKR